MTLIQSRQNVHDAASRPANDNHTRSPEDFSVLDLIPSSDDDDVAEIVRRTERLAIAVLIGMAICLILAPVAYIALMYGMPT
ncbi:hypothetical protein D3227_18105 [Mesorhizobium waimense]|uniref:Uncharacterized protein n=1 Tax=Mesorhizobium waimense TaxID=1300307 RepID=A0A3A5KXN7_9HYPH|nr:hypothetical protein [Mesorhizobium waimense]RJT37540.1 hypothetical protein D3227_18105 [Mesorhizobium waimense]